MNSAIYFLTYSGGHWDCHGNNVNIPDYSCATMIANMDSWCNNNCRCYGWWLCCGDHS